MKTKIVAWWIIIYGIVYSSYKFFEIYYLHKTYEIPKGAVIMEYPQPSDAIVPIILAILLYFLIGVFLIKKKKMAWYFAVGIFSWFLIGSLFNLFGAIFQKDFIALDKLFFVNLFSMLIFVVLLLIDRKNFWKVAT